MNNIKQVIVLRKDLNMRKGKMCAQAAHASLTNIIKLLEVKSLNECEDEHILKKWLFNNYTKIVLSVNNEEELDKIYQEALKNNLNASLIEDLGLTEFKGILTKTCVCIGPDYSDNIDKITKHLNLL